MPLLQSRAIPMRRSYQFSSCRRYITSLEVFSLTSMCIMSVRPDPFLYRGEGEVYLSLLMHCLDVSEKAQLESPQWKVLK